MGGCRWAACRECRVVSWTSVKMMDAGGGGYAWVFELSVGNNQSTAASTGWESGLLRPSASSQFGHWSMQKKMSIHSNSNFPDLASNALVSRRGIATTVASKDAADKLSRIRIGSPAPAGWASGLWPGPATIARDIHQCGCYITKT